jgi:hypothetical protein
MLAGLDDIDWHSLRHAYGPADDVSGQLRSLLSSDPEEREKAVCELFSNIWHQGTIYEATIFAVPFLIELLASPGTPDKQSIACLLASIATGTGNLRQLSESQWKSIFAKQGKDFETERRRDADITRRVHEAVRAALPLLVPFLSDPAPDLRICIPPALAEFPDNKETNLPVLEQAFTTEQDADVHSAIETAIRQLRGDLP